MSYGVRNIEFLIGDLKVEKERGTCLYCEVELNTFVFTMFLKTDEYRENELNRYIIML